MYLPERSVTVFSGGAAIVFRFQVGLLRRNRVAEQ